MEEIIESGHSIITNGGAYTLLGGSGSSGTGNINAQSNIVYTYPYPQTETYVVFELPRYQMPRKIYLNGRLVTVGMLGNDVQAAYDGKNKVIFRLGELNSYYVSNKITVSVEYSDSLYHYNVEHTGGVMKFKPNSTTLSAVLISEIEQ